MYLLNEAERQDRQQIQPLPYYIILYMDTTQLSESIVGEHLERKFAVVQWSEGEDSTICLSEIMSAYCKSKALTRKDPAEDFLEKYCRSEPTSDDRSPRKTIFVLKREIKDLKEENAKLKEMVVQDVPEILRTMKNILDSAVPPKRSRLDLTTPPLPPQSSYSSSANSSPSLPRSTPPSSMSESVTPSLTDSQSSKVEIHPGTGVMVEKLAWTYVLNANSATVFVRHLLTAVFPLEILLLSNLRGGKRGGGDARLPLDKNTLDAIYSATLERWPGTQLSSIGTTINGKITELRTKSKNVAVSTASS